MSDLAASGPRTATVARVQSGAAGRSSRIDIRGLSVLALLILVWEVWQRHSGQSSVLTASFIDVGRSAVALTRSGDLWVDYRASLFRVTLGFGVGAVLGLVFGAVLGVFDLADRLIGPIFTTLRQVPIFGFIPLIGLWFGTGDLAKIVLISTAAFYPILLHTHEGLRGAPRSYRDVATVLIFSRNQLLRRVLFPAAMPSILTGIKHGLAYAWIACIGAELFMASDAGMGSLLAAGRASLRMDYVLLGIVIIGATGYVMALGVNALERRILAWRPEFKS